MRYRYRNNEKHLWPMSETLPPRTSPSEDILQYLRDFARFYKPEMGDDVENVEYMFRNLQEGSC